ncbi:MAG: hypothetical protein JNK82_09920 [Myxococcaceae bacterium]|nr:hypothetical protein [Myxococcaceae bacterium]
MLFFDSHVDAALPELARGGMSGRRLRRVLAHAKACHRCAPLYQRAVHTLRQLETGSPFEPAQVELDAIVEMNAQEVLKKAAPPPAPRAWLWAPLAAGALVAAAVFYLPRLHESDALEARGGPAGLVALRVFCGGAGQPLKELREADECESGRTLAFAAGAVAEGQSVALVVSGDAVVTVEVAEPVTAPVGAEAPVKLTVELRRRGSAVVTAAFASDVEQAKSAARGLPAGDGVSVVRRTVRVGR